MRTPISNKTKIKEGIIAVLVICLIACTSIISYAAGTKATIPVRQELTGSGDAAFTYILTAEDPRCPLPADANDGRYSFSLSGNNTKEISIEFNKVGIYEYKLEQLPETIDGKTVHDEEVYTIQVYARYSEAGIIPQIVIKNKAGDKPAEAVFKCELITEKVEANSELVNSGDAGQMTVWIILFLIAFISLLIWLIRSKRL